MVDVAGGAGCSSTNRAILAPIIGGYLLGWGSWRLIFWVMAALGVAGWLWGLRALPDSLPVAQRVPLQVAGILRAYARQMRDPVFILYTLAGGFILGSLFVYISASAFVFTEHFKLDAMQFSYLFAANSIALVLGGSISNLLLKRGGQTRHIMLLGTLVHGLFGLLLFAAVQSGWASLAVYGGLLAVSVGSLGLIFGNLTALTMNSAGQQLGVASALMGSLHYLSAAVVGYLVSLAAPGLATLPLAIALCGMLTLSTCLLAQRAALRAALR